MSSDFNTAVSFDIQFTVMDREKGGKSFRTTPSLCWMTMIRRRSSKPSSVVVADRERNLSNRGDIMFQWGSSSSAECLHLSLPNPPTAGKPEPESKSYSRWHLSRNYKLSVTPSTPPFTFCHASEAFRMANYGYCRRRLIRNSCKGHVWFRISI